MKYEFNKCLGDKQGQIKEKNMKDLLRNHNCKLESINQTTVKVEGNSISYSYEKFKKLDSITPTDLDQIDYSKIFFFSDLKVLNEKICKDSCKKPKTKCKNYGIINPNGCKNCICPHYYEGKNCETTKKGEFPKICGTEYLKASSRTRTKTLNLDAKTECFYRIKPSSNNKKVVVTFKPHVQNLSTYCGGKNFEINYYKDKSKTGVWPCGDLKKFTIKGSKGATVSIYSSNIFHPPQSKMTMEYKEIKS
uniref:EGF-like domain-containing protein n=1 Tax=Strongyloides papillosus TaxID=174720 RepID=A0A0N5B927_STREA